MTFWLQVIRANPPTNKLASYTAGTEISICVNVTPITNCSIISIN